MFYGMYTYTCVYAGVFVYLYNLCVFVTMVGKRR